ncbi:g8776 [Coccomyxa elongata]
MTDHSSLKEAIKELRGERVLAKFETTHLQLLWDAGFRDAEDLKVATRDTLHRAGLVGAWVDHLTAISADCAGEASNSDNWGYPVGSPSPDGLPGRFKELQSRPVGPLFLTHRPASAQAIPFALLDEGFALFLDVQAGRKGQDIFNRLSNGGRTYLHCDYKRLKISMGKTGQPPQTDGTATVMRNGEEFPYQWGEFKLEVGQGGADPQAESLLYFFHFIRTKARTRRMLPGLMLEQFGAYLRISGIANVGEHVACEPLTPALHLLDLRPHQPEYMEQLAQTLRALRLTAQHYRIGYETGSLPKHEASPLPYVLRRSRDAALHGQAAGQNVLSRAELTSGAMRLFKDKLLAACYTDPVQLEASVDQTATADDTRSASVSAPAADVRSSAAAQPVPRQRRRNVQKQTSALAALAHPLIPRPACHLREWSSLLCILQSGDLEQIRAAVAAAQGALARAHAIRLGKDSKLVWGDARPSNFLLRWLDDGTIDVRLIDFDWSGAEGAVAYPGYLNSQVPWARGVRSHDPIVQTHDVELLRNSICEELLERFGYVPDVMDSGAAAADSGAAAADSASAQAEKPGSPGSRVSDVPRVQPEPNAGKRPKASQRRERQSKPPAALLPASAPAQIFHAAAAPARRLCPKLCRRGVLVRVPVSRGPCMGFV